MSEDSQIRQLVIFTLGADQYALGIEQVQEIIRYQTPRPVGSSIKSVRGVISLRGRIVPIYDIAELLGTASTPCEQSKIVIVETGEGTAGVIVDEVIEVLSVEAEQFEPLPDTGSALIESVVKLDDQLIVLVDLTAVFAGEVDGPAMATASIA